MVHSLGAWIASVVASFVYFVTINPTIGGALVAGVFLTINTLLTERRWRNVHERLNERRNVFVKGTPDDPETVIVTAEERRELEDRRAKPRSGGKGGRRHSDRRKGS